MEKLKNTKQTCTQMQSRMTSLLRVLSPSAQVGTLMTRIFTTLNRKISSDGPTTLHRQEFITVRTKRLLYLQLTPCILYIVLC